MERLLVSNGSTEPEWTSSVNVVAGSGDEEVHLGVDDVAIASISYTSGTTSIPNGVMRTHQANLWNATNAATAIKRRSDAVEPPTRPPTVIRSPTSSGCSRLKWLER